MGKRIYRLPCDSCGSSDAVTLYEDNHQWCFACNHYTPADEEKDLNETNILTPSVTENKRLTPIPKTGFVDMSDRGINHQAAEKYRVFRSPDSFYSWVYPRFKDGVHVANKLRTAGKKGFSVEGNISEANLFGQDLFPPGSAKQITLCEGQDDALAAYQMQGFKYPCVSVDSTSSAVHDVAKAFNYLNAFDEIVICFDTDEAKIGADGVARYPGQEAAVAVASMFKLGKVRVLTLSRAKDPNDYLKNGWSKEFIDEWWKAPHWTPVGLKHAKDMWEEVKKLPNYESVSFPWKGLQDLTYGLRLSELVTITANPKVGKTSILREIIYHMLEQTKDDKRKIGLMFLEEPNRDTLLGLMSLAANKPLHLPDIREQTPEEELRKYFDTVYSNEKIVVLDHFGSNEINKILDYVRYMHNLGCKFIILDHLSIIVSGQNGDERKQLDEIATKLKQLTVELNICVVCVIHQNRKGEIRGTAGVEQLSNLVIKLYRDMLAEDPYERNTMKVSVEMNRFCGRTGPACLLLYEPDSGRMYEQSQKEMETFLNKSKDKKTILEDW